MTGLAERVASLTNGRVLDVGCGEGRYLAPGRVGIDRDASRVRAARERSALVCVADALRLPFADGAFDTAYAFRMLNDTGDIDAALAELRRVLRPGGRLLVHTRARHATGDRLDPDNGAARLAAAFARVERERDPGDERGALFVAER